MENVISWLSELPADERFLFLFSAFLLSTALFLILFVLLSRIIKTKKLRQEQQFEMAIHKSLNALLIRPGEGELPEPSFQYHLLEINKAINGNDLNRQFMTNVLVGLNKNLTGSSSRMVEKIYRELKLDAFSGSKLFSMFWKNQAKALRELTEMNSFIPENFQRVLLRVSNKTLKDEVFMAMVRLDKKHTLSFLDGYTGKITPWMRLNLYHHLLLLDPREVPQFNAWLTSPSEEVRLLCVSMVRQFRQHNAIPNLIPLLNDTNPLVVGATIQALSDLDAFDAADHILKIAKDHWNNEEISIAVIQYLSRISHNDSHRDGLEAYITHPIYKVRLEAVKSMSRDSKDRARLTERNQQMDGMLNSFIQHADEPLLN